MSRLLPAAGGAGAPPKRVLIADDDDDLREALAEVLRDEGWDVVEARDGDEAFQWMSTHDFHAVVLDERMPGRRGSEAYKAVCALGSRPPVILVTAAAQIESLAASLGIRCFLGKPFRLEALLELVETAPDRCE